MTYDDAVAALYQAAHDGFVAERKRLAGEVRTAGDRAGAARLLKLARPPVSAWATNQLHWQARADLDALLEAAARVRGGDVAATAAYRELGARLRQRAAAILTDAGHGASEATLRKVAANLAAIAAAGGFDPDPAGALSGDRDPPGFEAVGGSAGAAAEPAAEPAPTPPPAAEPAAPPPPPAESAADAAHRVAEQRRAEEARRAERARLTAGLQAARAERDAAARHVTALQQQLRDTEAKLAAARAAVDEVEQELASVDDADE